MMSMREEVLLPNVKHAVVYNFENEGGSKKTD